MSVAVSDLQPELALRMRGARSVCEDSVNELCGLLRGRGWVTRRELERLRPQWKDGEGRFIRELAEASNGAVISWPGSPGYRLTDGSTLADLDVDKALDHAAAATISQMKKMARRVRAYRTARGLRIALREQLGISSSAQ